MLRLLIKKILLLYCVFTGVLNAQIESDILRNFNKVFPSKSAVFDSLKTSGLGSIIFYQISNSYDINAIKTREQKFNLQLSLSEETYKPIFNLSAGIQGYNSADRLVDVIATVPVEWDNKNPIKTDYRLPNGGRGIMWVPQPLRWEEHSIELHASTAYKDLLQSYSMGFNYRTSYGLSINAFNLSLKNRLQPKTYGYPWSAVLSSSFELPLFKNAGEEGSQIETEKKITKINMEIGRTNSEIVSNNISYETIRNFFKIYFLWNKLKLLSEMISLTEVQLKDQQVLTEKNLISVYDRLRVEKEYRQMLSQKDEILFDYISYSAKLNPVKVVNSQDMYLYIPGIDSVRCYLDGFEDFLMQNYLGEDLSNLIYNHPELQLSQKSLDQAKVNLRYSVNQHKPDVSMTGSLAVFESDELGYTSIPNSLGNLLKKPDGVSWNLGFSYTFSLFSSPSDIQRQLAIEDYQEQQQNLEKTKENISLQANDFLFKLKSSHISLNSARNNLSYAQNIMNEGEQLFKIKRISRFDYNEYKKTSLSETMAILEVYNNQMELMSQFMQFMGVKPALVLQLINSINDQKRPM